MAPSWRRSTSSGGIPFSKKFWAGQLSDMSLLPLALTARMLSVHWKNASDAVGF